MKEIDNQILEKIKKLLDLANPDNRGTEGEMQSAFSMAQKLLKKHHLSMSQVAELDDESTTHTGFFELTEVEVVKYAANILPKWMEILIRSVNSVSETKTLIKRSPRAGSSYGNLSIVFVGDSLDVLSASELFTFLKNTVSKLSTAHCNDFEGKHKYWRSFAEGCSTKILERAIELEERFDEKFNHTADDLDVSNREITEDEEEFIDDIDEDEDEDFGEGIDEQIHDQNFSIELYNKYKNNKFEKIREYLDNLEAEEEKSSSRTAKLEVNSFELGQKAGETIPLTITKKLKAKK